jgi:hypothetical protein
MGKITLITFKEMVVEYGVGGGGRELFSRNAMTASVPIHAFFSRYR